MPAALKSLAFPYFSVKSAQNPIQNKRNPPTQALHDALIEARHNPETAHSLFALASYGRRPNRSIASELCGLREQLKHMRATLLETPRASPKLYAQLDAVSAAVAELSLRLEGDPARQKLSESDIRSISDRIWMVMPGHWETRLPPTQTQRRDLAAAETGLTQLESDLKSLMLGDVAQLEQAFTAAGAPWTPGRRMLH